MPCSMFARYDILVQKAKPKKYGKYWCDNVEEQVILEGVVEDIIFQNQENGYTVCIVEYEGEEVACVGIIPDVHSGEELRMVGEWITHHIYGKQFKVEFYERNIPTTVQGIEKYLASGVIKGIGPKLAKRIVKHFGTDTFRIIEEEPLVLAQVRGISENKANQISEIFHEQYELRRAMLFLQDYGITPNYAAKIYKKYREQTMEVIQTNPYRLADDIWGIGFKKADDIAARMGISKDSPHRIKTGILYVLNFFSNNGHTYIPKNTLMQQTMQLLQVTQEQIEHGMIELHIGKDIVIKTQGEKDIVFLSAFYYAEQWIARRLIDMAEHADYEQDLDIEKDIQKFEKDNDITLAQEQKTAVKEALSNGVVVITGGPGTGKTTTINTIINMLEKQELEVMLAAPTGRAAKRMSEATGREAQTIHRLLEIEFIQEDSKRQSFVRNEDNPLDTDVLIVDEMSMVDVILMNSLLKAMVPGQHLILVGDADQLPSVGAGNVLKDIINSGRIKIVRLTQIFRQAQESAIITNAHRINQGKYPITNQKHTDFFLMQRAVQNEVVETLLGLASERLPKFKKCDPLRDIQVLAPMRKGLLGVNELNKSLQQALNPPHPSKIEKEFRTGIFRTGDKVMQIKNNYNTPWKIYNRAGIKYDEGVGVFNGDCGIIQEINPQRELITVLFDDQKTVEYDYGQLDELELAYAVTIHKSQGSEYPIIILPIHSGPPMLLNRNLLYTAVTRAKNLVVVVGLRETVYKMVDNNQEIERFSSLASHMKNMP